MVDEVTKEQQEVCGSDARAGQPYVLYESSGESAARQLSARKGMLADGLLFWCVGV